MKLKNIKQDNSLSDKVYQQLFKSLITGNLSPGQKITEAELAKAMGISRSPIREALMRLAKDHLVELVPRSGCYVTVLTENEIREIYEIRSRLECMALEHAFEKLKYNPKPLALLLKDFKSCIGETNEAFIKKEVRLDTKLHDLIAEQSDCLNLREMLANLRTRLEIFRVQTTGMGVRATEALNEHIDIIQAILNDDLDLALRYLTEHIEHTRNNVLSFLKYKDFQCKQL